MAEVKISQLSSGTTLDGTEVVPIVQNNATVKITTQDIADLGGGGGGGGINSLIPLKSGQYTYNQSGGGNTVSSSAFANSIYLHAYIPGQSYTCSQVILNVVTAQSGGLGKVGIYDHVNGLPNNLIYESANIDCSTSGLKSLTTSIDFVAGEVYWIAVNFNISNIVIRQMNTNARLPINTPFYDSTPKYTFRKVQAFGSFPNPITGVATFTTETVPYLSFRKL